MTEQIKTRHPEKLSIEQQKAIDLLITGGSDADVARALGIARQTVWTWRNHNQLFIDELNGRIMELWRVQTNFLFSLVPEALQVLADDLRQIDNFEARTAAAVHVLKCAGLYGAVHDVSE